MDAVLFNSPAAFFAALLGARQHDAHVECWRGESWLRARREGSAAALRRSMISSAQLREREAQRLAETHGYDTAALSARVSPLRFRLLLQTAVRADTRPTVAPRDRDRVRTQG